VKSRWVAAIGNNSRWIAARTSREVEIALREESRQAKAAAERERVNPAVRTHRQTVLRPEHFDTRLAVQQEEMQYLYDSMGMTVALPHEVPKALREPTVETKAPRKPKATPAPIPQSSRAHTHFDEFIEVATLTAAPSIEIHAQEAQQEVADEVVEILQDGTQFVLKPTTRPTQANLLRRTGRFI
jgi:hypothetical protein